MTVETFGRRADEYLSRLSNRLRRASQYQFSALKPFFLPKPDGKWRVICIPTIEDRIVQRSLLDYLSAENRLPLKNHANFAFVSQIGDPVKEAAKTAAAYRADAPWVYKSDIKSFFDEIDRGELKRLVRAKVRWPSIQPLLLSAIDCEIEGERTRTRKQGIVRGRGVRQGMVLSPWLSNLVLWGFDQSALSTGLRLVRYADDFAIFCNSRRECEEVHEFCVAALSKLKLRVDPIGQGKTRICEPEEVAEFLGVGISRLDSGRYALKVTRKQREAMKSSMLDLSDDAKIREEKLTLQKILSRVKGMEAGWGNAYDFCDNAKSLRDAMADWREQTITRALRRVLGAEIGRLSKEQRRFLEL